MMNISVFRSLKNLGYDIARLGPRWPGLSEMYAYKGDYKSPQAVYIGDSKALVYRGRDREERDALGTIASELDMSFAYPLKQGDERVIYAFEGEVRIAPQKKSVAIHDIILGKQ